MTNALDVYVGFDSAWTDKASAPGAICALEVRDGRALRFHAPRLARFSEALVFIDGVKSPNGCTLVALDQPTIVPNAASMRPVERTAAGLVSWLGGGVQPSNRGKVGMFCNDSPIWCFLTDLGATEAPEECRAASSGLFIVEVFPALALPSIDPAFFGRLCAPRYNPARKKTFRLDDWGRVATAAAASFADMHFVEAAAWCAEQADIGKPRKADQDRLDAMLCLLIGLRWRLRPREEAVMLGCLQEGYMVSPATLAVRERLKAAADKNGLTVV